MGYCWIEIKYCNIVCEGVGHTKGSGPLVKGSACEVINSSASVGRDSAGLSLKRTLHTYIAILILAIYMYGIATFLSGCCFCQTDCFSFSESSSGRG